MDTISFWALSLYKAKDYEKAKIPMLPITNGIEETKKKYLFILIVYAANYYIPYIYRFYWRNVFNCLVCLHFYYNYICYDLFKFKKNKFDLKKAKKVFSYSILYLFLIFVLFLIDRL